jgi:hypothetical protein
MAASTNEPRRHRRTLYVPWMLAVIGYGLITTTLLSSKFVPHTDQTLRPMAPDTPLTIEMSKSSFEETTATNDQTHEIKNSLKELHKEVDSLATKMDKLTVMPGFVHSVLETKLKLDPKSKAFSCSIKLEICIYELQS